MNEEELRSCIAANIAFYRKEHGDTQLDLAEKLNYSDKSVSKWERAEGIPDVFVLLEIARLYRITLEDLLSATPRSPTYAPRRVLVSLLSVGLVILVASVVFLSFRLFAPAYSKPWLAFIFALPVSCIVLVIFAGLWWRHRVQCLCVSGLIWSLALSIHLSISHSGMSSIYVVAGIVQVLCVLWFLLKSRSKKGRR